MRVHRCSSWKSTLRSLTKISRRRYDPETLRFVVSARSLLEGAITKAWREIGQTLRLYERAYQGLTEDQKPESFRRFLREGPSLFMELGERIGRLEQVVSFWTYRLEQHAGMSPDEVMDAMRDLLQGLSIGPTVAEDAPHLHDRHFDAGKAFYLGEREIDDAVFPKGIADDDIFRRRAAAQFHH